MKKWYKYRETETEIGKVGIETQRQNDRDRGIQDTEERKEGKEGKQKADRVTV